MGKELLSQKWWGIDINGLKQKSKNPVSLFTKMTDLQSNPVISRAVNSRKSVSRACTLDPKF